MSRNFLKKVTILTIFQNCLLVLVNLNRFLFLCSEISVCSGMSFTRIALKTHRMPLKRLFCFTQQLYQPKRETRLNENCATIMPSCVRIVSKNENFQGILYNYRAKIALNCVRIFMYDIHVNMSNILYISRTIPEPQNHTSTFCEYLA